MVKTTEGGLVVKTTEVINSIAYDFVVVKLCMN